MARFSKVIKELNIGRQSAIEYLRIKGLPVEDDLNAKLTDEQVSLLTIEFGHNKNLSGEFQTHDNLKINLLYDEDKYFLGVVKFFDIYKDFGFIVTNNCNMTTPIYDQNFYANSSSFIEKEAKKEGRIVVFQIEKQWNGKGRAVNVRRFTKSDEDAILALSYYGDHECIDFNNKKTNLYNNTYKPSKLVAKKVMSIITNDEERSPQRTLQHFKFFIEHYKIGGDSKSRYIFDREFTMDYKSVWFLFFSIFTDEERIEILKSYPSSAKYFDNIELILKWKECGFFEEYTLPQLEEIKTTIDYLPKDCFSIIKERIEVIVDVRIKNILAELSKRSDIVENDFNKISYYGNFSRDLFEDKVKTRLIKDLLSYFNLTSKKYDDDINKCLIAVFENRFKNVLVNFAENHSNTHARDSFYGFINSMSDVELSKHKEDILQTVAPIIDEYINQHLYHKAISLLGIISSLNESILGQYRKKLYPLIVEHLSQNLLSNINNPDILERSFLSDFDYLTSVFGETDKELIKQKLLSIIKETKSVAVLSIASTNRYSWLSIEEALLLTKRIVSSWSFQNINEFLKFDPNLFDNNLRFAEIIIERAVQLVGSFPLSSFFDGTTIKETKKEENIDRNPERENCTFLNHLRTLIPDGQQSEEWNKYVNSRSAEDLLTLYDNGVIDTLPESVVEGIINSISLESVYLHESKWYNKPTLQNKTLIKVLKNTSVDLFPLIAKRLLQMEMCKDNIPLAVLLTELMTCNKPDEDDYYFFREWANHFQSHLVNLKKSTTSCPRISVILWAVHFQSTTSLAALSDVFSYLPPYLQIRSVKKLFQLIALGKINHTAESLYSLIKSDEKDICFPLEIAFAYLMRREKDPALTLDHNIMLQLLDGRDDHAEWIGIKQLMTECFGRWTIKELSDDRTNWKRNNYYNGIIDNKNDKLRVFVPTKMVDENADLKDYNNVYFHRVVELIKITYSDKEYQVEKEPQGLSYSFNESYEPELFAIARSFNFKFNGLNNFLTFERKEEDDDLFCECRLSNNVDKEFGIAFYWCKNRPCFCSPIRFRLINEWEHYTILDFMRILNIPTDYVNKANKKTRYGHYIILSSYLKSFATFYEHLKCRNCGMLMKPSGITNFTTRAVTEFSCENEFCVEKGKAVYLNHCFNKQNCDAIIDSRDSKTCPNGQYICPECGACCSTGNFRKRIDNLHENGGYISKRLIEFVENELGHWEKKEFFCFKCGKPMKKANEGLYCADCDVNYKDANDN